MTELIYSTGSTRYDHQEYTLSTTLFTTANGATPTAMTIYFHVSPSGDVRLNSVLFPTAAIPGDGAGDRLRSTTPIPESLRPGAIVYGTISFDNGTAGTAINLGQLSIDTGGVIRFYAGATSTVLFPNANQITIQAVSFNYQRRNPF